MANDVMVGAHSYVLDPQVDDSGLQVGDRLGRMVSGLSRCEVEETAMAVLCAFAKGPSS
jgi:hypothetical protein